MKSHLSKSNDSKAKMLILDLVLCLLFLLPSEAWVQGRKPMTITEIATYSGADREQLLYSGAKSEGKLVWYTSLAGESYKGMVKAFETKYPGVKIEAYRVSGSDMTTRLYEESKAKKYIADTVETTEGNLMFMRDAFLVASLFLAALCFLSGRRQGKRRKRFVFLGDRARVLHRLRLQYQTSS